MEWDEFYGYIHEQGMAKGADSEGASTMKYNSKTVGPHNAPPRNLRTVIGLGLK